MLNTAHQPGTVIEMKLAEVVRNDRALAAAAAKMNAGLKRSLLVSRMLTAFAVTMCALVTYVVHHQGNTIEQQLQLIRVLYHDNQDLMHYRMTHPDVQAPQQPASEEPSDDQQPRPTANPNSGQTYRADGCVGGVCA